MARRLLGFSFIILFVVIVQHAESATPKQQVITKVKNMLTSFCTDAQLGKLLDFMADETCKQKTVDQLLADSNEIVKYFMGTLANTQMSTVMSAVAGLQKDLGAGWQGVLSNVIGVMRNNLEPLYNNILKKVKSLAKNKNKCYNQAYTMTNGYFTKDRVKTILTRLKAKLKANEWTSAKKNLGTIIKFNLYKL